MRVGQRRLVVVADLLVELVVLLLRDVFFGAAPQGGGLVDGFPFTGFRHLTGLVVLAFFPLFLFHLDGQGNMVRVFADDALELPGVEVVTRVVFEVQDHAGAALGAFDLVYIKLAGAGAGPAHAFARRQAGAPAFHGDAVGHDEAGVKAHAELADQLRVAFLVARELGDKLARAALGDGAQVVDGFLLRQADAVVGDGQGFGGLVKADAHLELRGAFVQAGVVQRFKAQLVAGVRGVGNEFPQKDVRVGIQRMRDQLQQLGDFGLKGKSLFFHGERVGDDGLVFQGPDGLQAP